MESVEEFEEIYGDLQSRYNKWRRSAEEHNIEEREHGGSHPVPYFVDCGFAEAREDFSQYCDLLETIPFDVMLFYENHYSIEEYDPVDKTDCSKCKNQCIHKDAFRRLPREVGGLGLCENL